MTIEVRLSWPWLVLWVAVEARAGRGGCNHCMAREETCLGLGLAALHGAGGVLHVISKHGRVGVRSGVISMLSSWCTGTLAHVGGENQAHTGRWGLISTVEIWWRAENAWA